MNMRETATVLAALRLLQETPAIPARLHCIATNGDQCNPLTDEEIDALCEKINAPRG